MIGFIKSFIGIIVAIHLIQIISSPPMIVAEHFDLGNLGIFLVSAVYVVGLFGLLFGVQLVLYEEPQLQADQTYVLDCTGDEHFETEYDVENESINPRTVCADRFDSGEIDTLTLDEIDFERVQSSKAGGSV